MSKHAQLIESLRNLDALSVDSVQTCKIAASTIDHQQKRIKQLKARNTKLLNRNDELAETCLNFERQVVKLEAEIQRLKNCLVSFNPPDLG